MAFFIGFVLLGLAIFLGLGMLVHHFSPHPKWLVVGAVLVVVLLSSM